MARFGKRELLVAAVTVICGALSVRAGCTHWRVHLEGKVRVDPAYAKYHGAPIRIRLKAPADGKDARGQESTLDRSKPLTATYHPPRQGKGEPPGKGAAGLVYSKDKPSFEFQYCSGLVDVWYRGDLEVWLDVDRDGERDPDEPGGTLKQNPLTREKEEALREGGEEVEIVISPRPDPRRRPPRRKARRPRRTRPAARPARGARPAVRPAALPRPRARPRPREQPRPRPRRPLPIAPELPGGSGGR